MTGALKGERITEKIRNLILTREVKRGEPVIRVIHRYPVLHPLAYLVERSVDAGGESPPPPITRRVV